MTVNHILPKLNALALPAIIAAIAITLAILPLKLAAVAVVAVIGVTVALVRPKLGLYALIFAIPFSSLFQMSIGGANVGIMEGLLALTLGAWILKMAAQREIIIPYPPLLYPILLFLAAVSVSWLGALSFSATLSETAKWLEMLVLMLFIAANFTAADTRWLVGALLLAGAAEAALGVYQFVFKVGPAGFLLFGGKFLRAYGTFRQPNPFAGYLGLVLPLALAIFLWAVGEFRRKTTRAVFWLTLSGGSLAILLAGLFASQSRGGMLGFAVAATVVILLMGGRWTIALVTALIGGALFVSLGGLALVPPTIVQRFADVLPYIGVSDVSAIAITDANFAAIERLAHWQAARGMWRDHLWFGVGFGNYAAVYGAYAVGRWTEALGHAHNYLLNIGAETGLVGLLGYMAMWVWVFGFALWRWRRASGFQRAAIVGGIGIFAHLHTHNLFDNLYVQGMYLHIAIIFGLITVIAAQQKRRA